MIVISTVVALAASANYDPGPGPLLDPALAGLLPLAWVSLGLVLIRVLGPRDPATTAPGEERSEAGSLSPSAR